MIGGLPLPTRWPAAAIRDTVAAIVRAPGYRRTLRTSILQRAFHRFMELIGRTFRALAHAPHAREWTLVLLATLLVILVARLIYAGHARREARARPAGGRVAVSRRDDRAEARRAAAEGRFTEAAHALYRATLQALASRERLRLDPSKTVGDYARDLRRNGSSAYDPFRVFGRHYERAVFGAAECGPDGWAALLASAAPLLGAEVAA